MASTPVAAGSRVPAWPAFCASSAHFALATAAADETPGRLVEDEPAVHRPAADAAGHGVSPRGRAGPSGERSSSRVRSIWSKRVSARKSSSGENFRSIRSVTSRRISARLRPSARTTSAVLSAAERQHEGGGVPQVGRHPDLGDGDRGQSRARGRAPRRGRGSPTARAGSPRRREAGAGSASRRRGILSLPCASHPIGPARSQGRRPSRTHLSAGA